MPVELRYIEGSQASVKPEPISTSGGSRLQITLYGHHAVLKTLDEVHAFFQAISDYIYGRPETFVPACLRHAEAPPWDWNPHIVQYQQEWTRVRRICGRISQRQSYAGFYFWDCIGDAYHYTFDPEREPTDFPIKPLGQYRGEELRALRKWLDAHPGRYHLDRPLEYYGY